MKIPPNEQKMHEKTDCGNVIVKCRAHNLFCDWTGKRSEVQEHRNKCPFIAQLAIVSAFKHQLDNQKQEMQKIMNQQIQKMQTKIDNLEGQIVSQMNEITDLKNGITRLQTSINNTSKPESNSSIPPIPAQAPVATDKTNITQPVIEKVKETHKIKYAKFTFDKNEKN